MTTTLHTLTAQWLQESLGAINEETRRQYSLLMELYVYPKVGDTLSVSEEKAKALFDGIMADGKSESTAYTCVRLLRRVLEYGAAIGVCSEPEWDLDLKTPGRKRTPVILSPEEERLLTQILIDHPSPRNLGIYLILTTGIRPGEALELQWKDLIFKKKELRVKAGRGPAAGQKKSIRTIPLDERQVLYLRKMKSLPETYLCSGSSKPLTRHQIENQIRDLLSKEGLPPLSLMEIRHTHAVRCIEAGMSFDTLAARLGVLNSRSFRAFYRPLTDEKPENPRKVRKAPDRHEVPDTTPYRIKLEKRRQELKEELESLEGDLAILRNLRQADCVQGKHRKAFYDFVERLLPGDKDAQFAVDYLRANMRVESMSLRKTATPQAIRRRVTHGFEKLTARIDALEAVEAALERIQEEKGIRK